MSSAVSLGFDLEWAAIQAEHPRLHYYRDGGLGGAGGPDGHCVVGPVPVPALLPFRDHDGRVNGSSDETVAAITADLRAGKGLLDPLMIVFSPRSQWAFLGEGNHRLAALLAFGATWAPVRVARQERAMGDRKTADCGAPLAATGVWGHEPGYVPSDMHPQFVTSALGA